MSSEKQGSIFKSMLVPVGIAIAFLGWGLMVFFLVGDRPFYRWNYGTLPDVPGQSPYNTEGIERVPLSDPEIIPDRILRQHVDSNPNELDRPILEEAPDETP